MANAIERPIEKCLWQLDDGRWCYGETQPNSDPDAPFSVVRVLIAQLPEDIRQRAYIEMPEAYWYVVRLERERIVVIDATEIV